MAKLKVGDVYDGPRSIQTIDGVTAHWAETKDGPVRLVQIDLAPDNPDDGSEEYRIASDDDPIQVSDSIVDLEVDEIQGKTSTEA